MGRRRTIRLRLTASYVAVLVVATAVLLGMSWWLQRDHLRRTLPDDVAHGLAQDLALQYVLGVLGVALLALGLGWLLAGRALAPVRAIADTARRIGGDRLDARVRLDGPDDELKDLADVVDGMLDRVEASVDAQRRFVANASHELRTPLTVMRTEAEVALDDPDATIEELREVARAVVEGTERTEALLERLLVLAAVQGDTPAVRRDASVDLAEVTRRALRTAGAGDARADLDPVRVHGDDVLLERLVANLAENAVRHGQGVPVVRVAREADEAVVVFSNAGEVIPAELVGRLAEPFERLHRSRDRGAGLGLSIVRAIAEAHGGVLRLDAPGDGGLRAEVRLPCQAVIRT